MRNKHTLRQWGWNLIEVTVFTIQNQKVTSWRQFHTIRFNSMLASIEQSLDSVSSFKFDQWTTRNSWNIANHQSRQQGLFEVSNKNIAVLEMLVKKIFIPTGASVLSDHNLLNRAEATWETTWLTSSAEHRKEWEA